MRRDDFTSMLDADGKPLDNAMGLRTSGTYKHGLSYIPEYRCWQTMRLRCYVEANPAYKDYGARGITVCDRWLESPANFLEDMGHKPTPDHELDRIDNDKGYSKENCRWATRSQNDRNRRSNVALEINGVTRLLCEWAEITGVRADTAKHRMRNGWTPERAFGEPARAKAPKGFAKPIKTPCVDCGLVMSVGVRCHSCENKARPARIAAAKLAAADLGAA